MSCVCPTSKLLVAKNMFSYRSDSLPSRREVYFPELNTFEKSAPSLQHLWHLLSLSMSLTAPDFKQYTLRMARSDQISLSAWPGQIKLSPHGPVRLNLSQVASLSTPRRDLIVCLLLRELLSSNIDYETDCSCQRLADLSA
jgi:hypothetical protein